MTLDSLDQLDHRIEMLLARLNKLQKENEIIAAKLEDANARIKQLESELDERNHEKSEIKGRIEKLLARFDHLDLS